MKRDLFCCSRCNRPRGQCAGGEAPSSEYGAACLGPAVYHGGARTLYDFAYLQYLAKMLHPDLFADVDPAANLAAYFEKYMPVRLTGTCMTRLP